MHKALSSFQYFLPFLHTAFVDIVVKRFSPYLMLPEKSLLLWAHFLSRCGDISLCERYFLLYLMFRFFHKSGCTAVFSELKYCLKYLFKERFSLNNHQPPLSSSWGKYFQHTRLLTAFPTINSVKCNV